MTAKWVKTEINFKKLPEPLTKQKTKQRRFTSFFLMLPKMTIPFK